MDNLAQTELYARCKIAEIAHKMLSRYSTQKEREDLYRDFDNYRKYCKKKGLDFGELVTISYKH